MAARRNITVREFASSIGMAYVMTVEDLKRGISLNNPSIQKRWDRLDGEFDRIPSGEWRTNNNYVLRDVNAFLQRFGMQLEFLTSQIKMGSRKYKVPSLKKALLAWRGNMAIKSDVPSDEDLQALLLGSVQMKRSELSPKERLEYDARVRALKQMRRKAKRKGGKRKTQKKRKTRRRRH